MLTIDRFEGDIAVCQWENGTMIEIQRCELPAECAEGDTIEKKGSAYIKTDNRSHRNKVKSRFQKLFNQPVH